MSLSYTSNTRRSSAIALLAPPDSRLQAAIADFRDALSPQQRASFQAEGAPGPDAVIRLTTEIDAQQAQSCQRCIGTRLQYLLESVQNFSSIVDTFVSSNPNTAALVWGSVKFAMLIAMRVSPYLEKVTKMFMDLKSTYPRLQLYRGLFRESLRVQAALYNFYAEIVCCCKTLIILSNQKGFLDLVKCVIWPFDQDFSRMAKNISFCGAELNEEVKLATIQSLARERELQAAERKAASKSRKDVKHYLQHSALDEEHRRDLQAAKEADEAALRWQALLEKLSPHNHLIDYKRARQKQRGETASWVKETEPFKAWVCGDSLPFLWFSGRLGTGKTVAIANVVSHLCTQVPETPTVCFFFCQFNNLQTLTAMSIFSSLLRQYLEVSGYDPIMEKKLHHLLRFSTVDFEELVDFCEAVMTKAQVVVVDGLDECPEIEQVATLKFLKNLISRKSSSTRLLLSSRDSLAQQINSIMPPFLHISTDFAIATSSMSVYINIRIDEVYGRGELVVKCKDILETIKDGLEICAKGMFLWVSFQIEELCTYTRDEDILRAMENLPRDLPETYQRILSRVKSAQVELLKPVFEWVLVAKQPLTLSQLREATAIEPCQPYTMENKMRNDIHRAIEWSRSLLIIDDEDSTVQFTHPSVEQFLLDPTQTKVNPNFQFHESDLENIAGEVCVSYLHFSDFERTLMRRYPGGAEVIPETVLSCVATDSSSSKMISRVSRKIWPSRATREPPAIGRALESAAYAQHRTSFGTQSSSLDRSFLSYASQFWLYHSRAFEPSFKTYKLWTKLLPGTHHLAYVPWTTAEWNHCDSIVLNFVNQNDHGALLYALRERSFTYTQQHQILLEMMRRGNRCVLKQLSQLDKPLHLIIFEILGPFLLRATTLGDAALVQELLDAGADPNTDVHPGSLPVNPRTEIESWKLCLNEIFAALPRPLESYRFPRSSYVELWPGQSTPLAEAFVQGHENLIPILVDAGASLNGYQIEGDRSLLMHAIKTRSQSMTEMSITLGADVNGVQSEDGSTPLIAALENLPAVVGSLIERGVSVTQQANGRSPLVCAILSGQISSIRLLLQSGADVDVSLLTLAVQSRDCDLAVELLIEAGAEVESPRQVAWIPPLVLAAALGKESTVSILLNAAVKIDENTPPSLGRHLSVRLRGNKRIIPVEFEEDSWFTALHVASAWGHDAIVELLLRCGADTTIETAGNRNALYFAARHRRQSTVKKLMTFMQAENAQRAIQTTILLIIKHGDVDALRVLIENGLDTTMIHPEMKALTDREDADCLKHEDMKQFLQKLDES